MPQPKLMRSESDKIFAGVCGGIAAYLGVDSVFVRLAFILLIFASGIGVILYLALMILMPKEEGDDLPSAQSVQHNFEQFGNDVSSGMKRARQHPQGPTIAAGLLILLGAYFLFSNLGILGWLDGDIIWPMAIIALGVYILARRGRGQA
jgi:phage shock protein C